MNDSIVGFIGFGLIGGSIARALKEINPNNRLIAYNYNKNKVSTSLLEALKDKILDSISYDLADGFPSCDIIFLCAPVLSNITYLKQLIGIVKPECILTDVGSVKGNIHNAVEELGLTKQFIGGHPMAGSEKTGYENSNARLLENAYYILTPTFQTPKENLDLIYELVKDIGAIPLILNPKDHDDITAAISHVPHIIASSLVNLVKASDDSDEKMRSLAAGGFKDITRIASSSAVMWQNICLTNTDSIKHFLNQYIEGLKSMYTALDKKDEDFLFQFFSTASDYRDSIPNKSIGMIKKIFEIYLDIIDEAGAIATIATLLATNAISIKNIGIIHNREFEQGVLRIEFYEDETLRRAVELLNKYRYTVYER
jgi:prephenate dehydrogenase